MKQNAIVANLLQTKVFTESKKDVDASVEDMDLASMSPADKVYLIKTIIESCEKDEDCLDICEDVKELCEEILEKAESEEGGEGEGEDKKEKGEGKDEG